MSTTDRSYAETSVPVGGFFIALSMSLLMAHHYIGMFTSWTWAIAISSVWLVTGSLMLFPDVRLYQYDQSPLEQLTLEATET